MFKIHRMIKGTAVTLLVALGFIMIVWAHGRSAPQATNSVKAVQLRITFGQHWANVTAIEGGTFTVERDGKKLAITPYIRDAGKVEDALGVLKEQAAKPDVNLMPVLLDVARVHATEGEIVSALQDVWGAYTETPVF